MSVVGRREKEVDREGVKRGGGRMKGKKKRKGRVGMVVGIALFFFLFCFVHCFFSYAFGDYRDVSSEFEKKSFFSFCMGVLAMMGRDGVGQQG